MGAKKKRRFRRLLCILGVMLALAVGGLYLLVLALLPSAVVYAPNAEKTIDPAQDLSQGKLRALGISRALRVELRSPPASLSCWIVDPPAGPARSTVLALHGIRDSRRSLLGLGKELARRGHRAVLPDLRGHGRSSGRWLTYGVVESADLVAVLDRLAAQGLLVEPVKAVGFSYGGAVGLQLAARDRRVKAVATVATFTSLRAVVPLYLRRLVPVIGHMVTEGQLDDAVARAGRLASFDPARASPLRAIAVTGARVLLVHGADDRHIPADHARELHRAADPGQTRLLIIPGADHVTIMGHPRMKRAVLDWMGR
jgi:pimeloyl-ACP methyl ester carboxylesterase